MFKYMKINLKRINDGKYIFKFLEKAVFSEVIPKKGKKDCTKTIYNADSGYIYGICLNNADFLAGCIGKYYAKNKTFHIEFLYKDDYGRSGLGIDLMLNVINYAMYKQNKNIKLVSIQGINDTVLDLYRKIGFHNPPDALIATPEELFSEDVLRKLGE